MQRRYERNNKRNLREVGLLLFRRERLRSNDLLLSHPTNANPPPKVFPTPSKKGKRSWHLGFIVPGVPKPSWGHPYLLLDLPMQLLLKELLQMEPLRTHL